MNRLRILPTVLALGAFTLMALVGAVFAEVYRRHLYGDGDRAGFWFQIFAGTQSSPFFGRLYGTGLQGRDLAAWLLGAVVASVVLAVVVLLTSRAGSRTTSFVGGWLGSILAVGAGSTVSAVLWLQRSMPGSAPDRVLDQMRAQQIFAGINHGLYWGVLAGWLIGLAAVAGLVLGGRSGAPAPDSVNAESR